MFTANGVLLPSTMVEWLTQGRFIPNLRNDIEQTRKVSRRQKKLNMYIISKNQPGNVFKKMSSYVFISKSQLLIELDYVGLKQVHVLVECYRTNNGQADLDDSHYSTKRSENTLVDRFIQINSIYE